MRMFDPHIHMTSRTTDDYAAMAAAGIAAVIEPAFWLGQPRTHAGSFEDYFLALVGWERFRARQFGIRHYCTIALNPKEANNPTLADEVIALLPRYLEKDGVVAVGEIGYDDMTPAEERAFERQLVLAKEHDLPALVHTPHRDKRRGTERSLDLVRAVGFPADRTLIDHNNEETLAPGARLRLLGGALDLPRHEDGRAAHGGARQEIRRRAHDRQQRRRLGSERSTEGSENRGRDARRGHRGRRHRDHRVAKSDRFLRRERSARPPRAGGRAHGRSTRAVGRQLRASRPNPTRRELSRRMHRTLVIDVVGLTPALLGPNTPHLSRLAERGGDASAPIGVARRDGDGAVDLRHRAAAERPRRRGQRLVLSRPRRDPVLATEQSPRCRREDLGRRPQARSRVHVREALLVVQHVLERRLHGHAAPDVPGRRPQAARHLHATRRTPRRAQRAARAVSTVQFLGAHRRHRVESMDRRVHGRRRREVRADVDSRLPPAPGLRPSALRAERSADRRAGARWSTRSAGA